MPRSWNVFSIGRRVDDEDQLTEYLAWLASAVPGVRAALLELALGEPVDPAGVEVVTQHAIGCVGTLDAVLESPELCVVVESKLGSEYGPDQLGRYLRWLTGRRQEIQRVALMTLTARAAPWSSDDLAYAAGEDIHAAERRWEELHTALDPITDAEENEALSARIVRDFLNMLTDENLVPIRPLSPAELEHVWRDAQTVVRRYREFFRACKPAIAEALRAQQHPNSFNDTSDTPWQDYVLEDGTRVVVAFRGADENKKGVARASGPAVLIAVKSEHLGPDALKAARPEPWQAASPWGQRPTIWCPLADALGGGAFNEQRDRLATGVADAVRAWVGSVAPGV